MGLIDLFKKRCRKNESVEHCENTVVWNTFELLCQKSEYGDKMQALNEFERTIYIVLILEGEVNNGGFIQFFTNSSGAFANEAVVTFEKIGAEHAAKICRRALDVFGGSLPTNREEREKIVDSYDCEDALGECDREFGKYEEDLEHLCYRYIVENGIGRL